MHSNLLYPDPTRKRTIYRFMIEVVVITFPHWVALSPQNVSSPGYKLCECMDSWPTGLGSSLSYSNFAGSNSARDMLTRSQSGGNGCSCLPGYFTSNHLTACWVVTYIHILSWLCRIVGTIQRAKIHWVHSGKPYSVTPHPFHWTSISEDRNEWSCRNFFPPPSSLLSSTVVSAPK